MAANPVMFIPPEAAAYTLSGVTNANYQQQVELTDIERNQICTFSGSGENSAVMQCSNGSTSYVFDGNLDDHYQLFFWYQPAAGEPWALAEVFLLSDGPSPSGGTLVQYGTEDAGDGDNNDTVFSIEY